MKKILQILLFFLILPLFAGKLPLEYDESTGVAVPETTDIDINPSGDFKVKGAKSNAFSDTNQTDLGLNNTHRGTVTGNPHAVTKTEVGLANVTDNEQVKKTDGITVDLNKLNLKDSTELTIGTGAVTITQSTHTIDGESDLDDDLVTINGETQGDVLWIVPANAARNITLIHSTGNIITPSGSDYLIPDNAVIELHYDGTNWRVIGFYSASGGGDVTGPASSTTDNLPSFSDTSGKVMKDSGVSANNLVQNTRNINSGEGIQGGGDLSADRTLALNITSLTSEATPTSGDELVIWDGANHKKIDWDNLPGAAGGEANTASNVGGFAGLFKQKTGIDLEFKTVQSSDSSVSITNNASDIDFKITKTGVYRTLYVDAGAYTPCTTNGATTGTNEYATNDIEWDYFAFDGGATEERIQFKIAMPDVWDKSTIKIKFYWSSATGSTTADTVEWGIKAGALGDGDAIDTALGTAVTISDALLADNGTDLQLSSATAAMTVGGTPVLGDLVTFEIYRNTDGTDDMVEDAWLMGIMIQYKESATEPSAW